MGEVAFHLLRFLCGEHVIEDEDFPSYKTVVLDNSPNHKVFMGEIILLNIIRMIKNVLYVVKITFAYAYGMYFVNFTGKPIVPKLAISSPTATSSSASSSSSRGSSDPPLTAVRCSIDNQNDSKSNLCKDDDFQIHSGIIYYNFILLQNR